ncbi:hypothetical protein NPIL_1771 [Nephila pilipes]|uniref:Uncharacterized protein n=1 Tax=Nephila pilipes TaxID=299642 RepID=A0A8X6NE10_NEPPI|nr:hypothetical protein NPIL_1771 [Nephila pilipes]
MLSYTLERYINCSGSLQQQVLMNSREIIINLVVKELCKLRPDKFTLISKIEGSKHRHHSNSTSRPPRGKKNISQNEVVARSISAEVMTHVLKTGCSDTRH